MKPTPPLLAMSNVIIDIVTERDGTVRPAIAGGEGLYAALAMACWWPRVGLVAGVGADFAAISAGITQAYDLLPDTLIVRDSHSIRSELVYHADGNGRTERALFGPEHFARMDVTPDQIASHVLPAGGTYFFRDDDPGFWSGIAARRDALGVLLWEVDCRMTRAGTPARFAARAAQVDIVSLNLDEARELLGDGRGPVDLFGALCALAPSVMILRMGSRGAFVGCAGGEWLHIAPPPHPVIDPTGGGNAFTGGFLAGLCQRPGDLHHAGRCAATAAACAIAQRGPPPPPERALLDRLYKATVVRNFGPADPDPPICQEPHVPV